uniref:Uncharacterized protein n=1 Tax=Glossina austeni TaxID=7395 RepID=A0A1A9V3P5_GLOAU
MEMIFLQTAKTITIQRFKRGISLKVLASICHISLLSKNNVVTWVKPSNAFAGNSSNLLKPIAADSNSPSTTLIDGANLVCSVLRTTPAVYGGDCSDKNYAAYLLGAYEKQPDERFFIIALVN